MTKRRQPKCTAISEKRSRIYEGVPWIVLISSTGLSKTAHLQSLEPGEKGLITLCGKSFTAERSRHDQLCCRPCSTRAAQLDNRQ